MTEFSSQINLKPHPLPPLHSETSETALAILSDYKARPSSSPLLKNSQRTKLNELLRSEGFLRLLETDKSVKEAIDKISVAKNFGLDQSRSIGCILSNTLLKVLRELVGHIRDLQITFFHRISQDFTTDDVNQYQRLIIQDRVAAMLGPILIEDKPSSLRELQQVKSNLQIQKLQRKICMLLEPLRCRICSKDYPLTLFLEHSQICYNLEKSSSQVAELDEHLLKFIASVKQEANKVDIATLTRKSKEGLTNRFSGEAKGPFSANPINLKAKFLAHLTSQGCENPKSTARKGKEFKNPTAIPEVSESQVSSKVEVVPSIEAPLQCSISRFSPHFSDPHSCITDPAKSILKLKSDQSLDFPSLMKPKSGTSPLTQKRGPHSSIFENQQSPCKVSGSGLKAPGRRSLSPEKLFGDAFSISSGDSDEEEKNGNLDKKVSDTGISKFGGNIGADVFPQRCRIYEGENESGEKNASKKKENFDCVLGPLRPNSELSEQKQTLTQPKLKEEEEEEGCLGDEFGSFSDSGESSDRSEIRKSSKSENREKEVGLGKIHGNFPSRENETKSKNISKSKKTSYNQMKDDDKEKQKQDIKEHLIKEENQNQKKLKEEEQPGRIKPISKPVISNQHIGNTFESLPSSKSSYPPSQISPEKIEPLCFGDELICISSSEGENNSELGKVSLKLEPPTQPKIAPKFGEFLLNNQQLKSNSQTFHVKAPIPGQGPDRQALKALISKGSVTEYLKKAPEMPPEFFLLRLRDDLTEFETQLLRQPPEQIFFLGRALLARLGLDYPASPPKALSARLDELRRLLLKRIRVAQAIARCRVRDEQLRSEARGQRALRFKVSRSYLSLARPPRLEAGSGMHRFDVPVLRRCASAAGGSRIIDTGGVGEGDFLKGRALGRGAFGDVYVAMHRKTRDLYALKVISLREPVDRSAFGALLNEINVLKLLKGQFLTQAFYSYLTESSLHIVMEYMVGGDFRARLEAEGRFELPVARFYAAELVAGLSELHQSAVHRDLKPENLLLDAKGHLKLTDFGLSEIHKKLADSAKLRDSLGKLKGTPDYIPPEVIAECRRDAHEESTQVPTCYTRRLLEVIDWWAVGCLIYEFLVGCSPFSASNVEQVFKNIQKGEIEWPEGEDELPGPARDLITRLLTPNPHERLGFNGAEEVRMHPFFEGVQWTRLKDQEAPLKPGELPSEKIVFKQSLKAPVGESRPGKLSRLTMQRPDLLYKKNIDHYHTVKGELSSTLALWTKSSNLSLVPHKQKIDHQFFSGF